MSKHPASADIGRLTITRRPQESFYLLLDPKVDEKLTAHDLFHRPVRITLLPLPKKRRILRQQQKILIEADTRINIAREEIMNLAFVPKLYPGKNLAEIFFSIARNELPKTSFNRILQIANHQLSQTRETS